MIFWIVLFELLAGGRKIEEDIIKVIMIKMIRGEVRLRALRRFYKGEKIFKNWHASFGGSVKWCSGIKCGE